MPTNKKTKAVVKKPTGSVTSKNPLKSGRVQSYLTKNRKRLTIFSILLIVVLVLFLARSFYIVALVNGKPIFRHEVIQSLEQQGGAATTDQLITQKLIDQEAQKAGVEVTDVDIEAEIQQISLSLEDRGMTLDQALQFQGQTIDDLKKNIKTQLTVEKILSDEVTVSQDEVQSYYDENKDVYEDKSLEEVQGEITLQIKQSKLQTSFQDWISNLKTDANIIYLLEY